MGVVHKSVTCLKDCVTILEVKEKLSNGDHATIQRLLKKLETLDPNLSCIISWSILSYAMCPRTLYTEHNRETGQ